MKKRTRVAVAGLGLVVLIAGTSKGDLLGYYPLELRFTDAVDQSLLHPAMLRMEEVRGAVEVKVLFAKPPVARVPRTVAPKRCEVVAHAA